MAIVDILDQQVDSRKHGENCEFNGYLEDYLEYEENLDATIKEAFKAILAAHQNTKICVGLKSEINRDAISNQIIRYKDAFKLTGKPLIFPYILYLSEKEEERALLVVPYSENSYLYAKGYYYCMTEPGSIFMSCKNEIVATSEKEAAKIVKTFEEIYTLRCGAVQRNLDAERFHGYDELKNEVVLAAQKQKDSAIEELKGLEDRTPVIQQIVIHWFLLKKLLYVQYMVNKDILTKVYEGNIKKQRNQAKLYADEVPFLSYSELWRNSEEPTENKE